MAVPGLGAVTVVVETAGPAVPPPIDVAEADVEKVPPTGTVAGAWRTYFTFALPPAAMVPRPQVTAPETTTPQVPWLGVVLTSVTPARNGQGDRRAGGRDAAGVR